MIIKNQIHSMVLSSLQQKYFGKSNIVFNEISLLEDDKKLRKIFANYRTDGSSNSRGLRLSVEGLELLKPVFKSWETKMEEGFILMPRDILFLNYVCSMPWFVSSKKLVLFEAQLAMRLKLAGSFDTLKNGFDFNLS